MSVYIVFENELYEGMEVRAVFDTPEKANDYIHNNEPDDNSRCWLDWEEYEVG